MQQPQLGGHIPSLGALIVPRTLPIPMRGEKKHIRRRRHRA
jgi:hypothetical protein